MEAPTARVCAVCRKPLGCIPFSYKGRVDYYHLKCFRMLRRKAMSDRSNRPSAGDA